MQMRVSIARGLVTQPDLLLMDEPFGALDEITRHKLDADLLELWRKKKLTVIFVTHSIHEAVFLSSRVVMMAARPGRVVEQFQIDEPYPRSARLHGDAANSRNMPSGCRTACCAQASRRGADDDEAASLEPAARAARAPGADQAWCWYPALVGVVLLAWQGWSWLKLPPYLVPSPYPDDADAGDRLGAAGQCAAGHAEDHRAVLRAGNGGGRADLVPVRAEQAHRDRAVPVRRAAAGDAHRRGGAADHHLGEEPGGRDGVCAALVALFPIISNTTLGLRSIDPDLQSYFKLNRATRWQTAGAPAHPERAALLLRRPAHLQRPRADRRGGGGVRRRHRRLGTGLAYQILQAGFQLNIPRMFAALLLISLTGVALFVLMAWLSKLALGSWHASELSQD
jgi:hypothetical protein